MHPSCFAMLAALSIPTMLSAQCLPLGLSIDASGGRLGDAWRVDMNGTPSVPGFLGLDLLPGPTATPIGTVCLGLSPAVQVIPFLFDVAGIAAYTGSMPPTPAFVGISVYAAAISFDASQPGGFGLSNGDSITLREPRFWFVNPGSASPFGTTPGAIAATDTIGDTLAFSQALTTTVRDADTVPERGWLVLLLGNGSLAAYDGTVPVPVFTATLTGAAGAATKVLALPGGDALLLLSFGTAPSPFGGGTPGSIHRVSLPGGAVTSTALPAGNPDDLILVPGTTMAFLRLANAVVPFDHASSVLSPSIPLPSGVGGLVDWQISGSLLYCLQGGQAAGPFGGGQPAAISVVDVGSQSVLFTNPLAMAAPATMLRAGPGSAGAALYAYGSTAAALHELAQGSVLPVATIPVGSGITAMELSTLGTQWLMLCNGAGCGGPAVLGMQVGTTAAVPLTPLPGAPLGAIAISASAGYSKGCIVVGGNVATPFIAEPFVPTTTTLLPIGGVSRIVSD